MKTKLTIGISAYNEGKNLLYLLDSIADQVQQTFSICEVLVVSDASTDNTVAIAQGYKKLPIRCIEQKARHGKPTSLNIILRRAKGDVLIFMDADIILAHPRVFQQLIKPIQKGSTVGLVGGEPIPMPHVTLVEAAVSNYITARNTLARRYFSSTAYGTYGMLMACSRPFFSHLTYPSTILADDAFTYFSCVSFGFRVAHVSTAGGWFRPPQTMKDEIRQSMRHYAGYPQLYEYFPKDIVDKAYRLPVSILRRISLYQIRKNIVAYILLKILTTVSLSLNTWKSSKVDVKWHEITSSKEIAVQR